MRTFPVKMPSGTRYWTVIGEDLLVMSEADAYLRHLRFGRDAAESTTKTYAGAIAFCFSWCEATGQDWRAAAERMPAFVLWLRHCSLPGTMGGSATTTVRGPRRINCEARHRVPSINRRPDRASDDDFLALLRACLSARDRPLVILLARAGLRRGELVGLRREDVHFLLDSSSLGCSERYPVLER